MLVFVIFHVIVDSFVSFVVLVAVHVMFDGCDEFSFVPRKLIIKRMIEMGEWYESGEGRHDLSRAAAHLLCFMFCFFHHKMWYLD